MAGVSHSRQITSGSTAIWAVLADFGNLHRWAAGVDHCCLLNGHDRAPGTGLTRRVQSGRNTFVETIVEFDPPRLLAYDISGVPRGFTASNRWTLRPHGDDRTTVTLTSTATATNRVLRTATERVLAHLIAHRSQNLLDSLDRTLRENS